jgi:hypothetical protein
VSEPVTLPATRGDALALALDAYEALALVAETVADEWTYVSGLAAAGRVRIARATGSPPELPLAVERATAVVTAAAEARRIVDPHRAIDWLSTFPAVVELALGAGSRSGGVARPDGGEGAGPGAAAIDGAGPAPTAGSGPGA